VRVGTVFHAPPPNSLGEWIQKNRKTRMNPTYAIAGLLIAEGYAERPEPGYWPGSRHIFSKADRTAERSGS